MPGHFVLEWYEGGARRRKNVGTDTIQAHEALLKQRRLLEAKAVGVEVLEEPNDRKRGFEMAC